MSFHPSDVLSERTDMQYKTSDVRTIVARLLDSDKEKTPVEESLNKIRENGGKVKYTKERGTDNVIVLFVQTPDMREALSVNTPLLFQVDTTFGTSVSTSVL